MFFDDTNQAVSAFVEATMTDVLQLFDEIGPLVNPAANRDLLGYSVYLQSYKTCMTQFTDKLLNHTNKLRTDAPSKNWPPEMVRRVTLSLNKCSKSTAAVQVNGIESLKATSVQTDVTIPPFEGSDDNANSSPGCSMTGSSSPPLDTTMPLRTMTMAPPPTDDVTTDSYSSRIESIFRSGNSGGHVGRNNRLAGPKRILRYEQTSVLRNVYAKHPFLTAEQRRQLANDLNITSQQIKIWFQNRRFKDKAKGGKN